MNLFVQEVLPWTKLNTAKQFLTDLTSGEPPEIVLQNHKNREMVEITHKYRWLLTRFQIMYVASYPAKPGYSHCDVIRVVASWTILGAFLIIAAFLLVRGSYKSFDIVTEAYFLRFWYDQKTKTVAWCLQPFNRHAI